MSYYNGEEIEFSAHDKGDFIIHRHLVVKTTPEMDETPHLWKINSIHQVFVLI